jgi:hypothetical protein
VKCVSSWLCLLRNYEDMKYKGWAYSYVHNQATPHSAEELLNSQKSFVF